MVDVSRLQHGHLRWLCRMAMAKECASRLARQTCTVAARVIVFPALVSSGRAAIPTCLLRFLCSSKARCNKCSRHCHDQLQPWPAWSSGDPRDVAATRDRLSTLGRSRPLLSTAASFKTFLSLLLVLRPAGQSFLVHEYSPRTRTCNAA